MGAFNSPHKFDRDSLHQLQIGKIVKSTIHTQPGDFNKLASIKESKAKIFGCKKDSTKQSLQIQFGINRKQDNKFKTKQQTLF